MNMKKTIAAAAAGAMAVSATAASAAAATTTAATATMPTQGQYVYSLVKNFAREKMGTATILAEKTIVLDTTNPTNSSIYINLRDYGTTTGVAYINVKTNANASLTVQSTDGYQFLINRQFILNGNDRNFDGSAQDGLSIYRTVAGGDATDIGIDEQVLLNRGATTALIRYTTEIEHMEEKATELTDVLELTAPTVLAIDEGVTSTVALITTYTPNTYRVATNFVAFDPDGTIYEAPLYTHANTDRYSGGVVNIIEYLEGRYSIAGAYGTGWYFSDSTDSWFPVAPNASGVSSYVKVSDYHYAGRNTEWSPSWLTAAGAWTSGGASNAKDYQNVMAVINDTVANYDVVFTFATAAKPVMDSNDPDIGADHPAGAYDVDKGDGVYTNFNQHMYGQYGNDNSLYTPFDSYYWTAPVSYNLFTGGLVVNDYYTMQLSDTTVFSYSATTLSFDYPTLKDKAYANYNTWMDYIQTLRLATSTEWYWDNLTITWTAPVADTAESGEGLESDDVTLDEEPADAGEEEVVVPEEPVAPAPNPATGNSAVALAVIPVALAAAAIVAKKRK
ncbi:MAG: hypothetical protein LBL87_05505 [Ruminococcus sp.]|jgi:hypothetical protein|nr:hypothetical protein [Ruminococcus sp.]